MPDDDRITLKLLPHQVSLVRYALVSMGTSITGDLNNRCLTPCGEAAMRYTLEQITEVKDLLPNVAKQEIAT